MALLETGDTGRRQAVRPRKVRLHRWNPPDAGANQSVPEAGGGFIDNDGRFIDSTGDAAATKGVLQYLELERRPGAALLHGDLTGQPARRPLLPEQDLQRSRLRRLLAGGRHPAAARPTKKTSRPSPRSRRNSSKSSTSPGKPETEAGKAGLPELLRQPDALLRQLPGQRPRQARRDRPLRRHADRPHRRPRRDGPHPRRPAAEELQLLRGGDAGPARLLEPEAVPEAGRDRRPRLPRRLPADAGEPGGGAEERPRQLAGGRLLRARPPPEDAKPVQDYVVFTYDDFQSGPEETALPETAEPHRQHPRRALEAGQVPRRRQPGAQTRSRRSGRCTT